MAEFFEDEAGLGEGTRRRHNNRDGNCDIQLAGL